MPLVPPTVVHVRNAPFDLYIGRAWAAFPESKWRNPFHLRDRHSDAERAQVLARYRAHVFAHPELVAALPELSALALGCWCKPKMCHGDVLVELFIEIVMGK